jgi:hypothetical protein
MVVEGARANVSVYGGVTSPYEFRRLADVAEKCEAKMVKITGAAHRPARHTEDAPAGCLARYEDAVGACIH